MKRFASDISAAESEEFVQPEAPTPIPNVSTSQQSIPVSPDMKHARYRLGNLLSGIRKGDIGTYDKDDDFDSDQGYNKKGLGRPSKRFKRERKITYELRDKVFSVRDSYTVEPIYPLLRKWVYGRDDDFSKIPETEFPILLEEKAVLPSSLLVSEDSLDLLATKEIHKMPDPLPTSDPNPLPPMRVCSVIKNPLPEGSAAQELLQENLNAWKNCKKQHKKYMQMREMKYEPSLKLLKTVHAMQNAITQQTSQ